MMDDLQFLLNPNPLPIFLKLQFELINTWKDR